MLRSHYPNQFKEWCDLGEIAFDKKNYPEAFRLYKLAADKGYPTGWARLAFLYEQGYGVEKNPIEADKYCNLVKAAAHIEDVVAQNNLGYMYNYGHGVSKDEKKAFEWYMKAAEKGDAPAQVNVGIMYENGEGIPKDETKAVEWYTKSAEQGYVHAYCSLGRMYENGHGVPKDETKAIECYTKAAEQGCAQTQAHLGWRYIKGHRVPKDEQKAVDLFTKSAQQGHGLSLENLKRQAENGFFEKGNVFAQFNLGRMYEEGHGVLKDEIEAVKWYQLAAEQKHPDALNTLKKLARNGNAEAQFQVGALYANGQGVTKDESRAVKWYRLAAQQGDAKALSHLIDLAKETWFTHGNPEAQFSLGVLYQYGRGVRKNEAEAINLFQLAAQQNHTSASKILNKLSTRKESPLIAHKAPSPPPRSKSSSTSFNKGEKDKKVSSDLPTGVSISAISMFNQVAVLSTGETSSTKAEKTPLLPPEPAKTGHVEEPSKVLNLS